MFAIIHLPKGFRASLSFWSACEHVPQPVKPLEDTAQDDKISIAILNISGMDDGVNHIVLDVGRDVSLSPFALSSGVVASRPATFHGFDALAVDHTGARRGLTHLCFTDQHGKLMVQGLPKPRVTLDVEPVSHR